MKDPDFIGFKKGKSLKFDLLFSKIFQNEKVVNVHPFNDGVDPTFVATTIQSN